jgi:predicted small secreted protein
MRCPSRLLRLAILFALALTLAACDTLQGKGKLDVDLAALKECRKLTPGMRVSEIGSESDYRALSAEALGTINKGNKAIDRRNRCDDKVINGYATAQGK